jgi:twinkle protein
MKGITRAIVPSRSSSTVPPSELAIRPSFLGSGEERARGHSLISSTSSSQVSAHRRNKANAGIVVYRDYEEEVTFVISKKIRRQPMCGRLGSVTLQFIGANRRCEAIPDSFKTLGSEER